MPRPARRSPGPVRRTSRAAAVVVGLIAVLWSLPTLGLFVTSLRPSENAAYSGWWEILSDHQVTLDNYRDVLTGGDMIAEGIWPFFVNTVVIVVPVVVVGIALASMAAYALMWTPFRGAGWLLGLVVALQVVPVQMMLLPLQELFYLGWHLGPVPIIPAFKDSSGHPLIAGSFASLWIAHTIVLLPFGVFLMHRQIASIPRALIDAARVDGASHPEILRRVVLPLSVPALASLAIFQVLWVWNDLLLASTFVSGDSDHAPLTPYLGYLNGSLVTQQNLLAAGTFIAIALPMAVFLVLQRAFARGLMTGALVE